MRVNFNYFISEPVFEYILEAVSLVARDGWRMLGEYRFDPARGLWVHRHGSVEPPLRLGQVSYRPDGTMHYPRHQHTAPESALAGYLQEGAALLAATIPPHDDGAAGLVSADFEHLRWFDLPRVCLQPPTPT